MINSTSSQGTPTTTAINAGSAGAVPRPKPGAEDSLSINSTQFLHARLASEPGIRPEVVERGRALAADPNYPPAAVIAQVAKEILNSPDPSEDLS